MAAALVLAAQGGGCENGSWPARSGLNQCEQDKGECRRKVAMWVFFFSILLLASAASRVRG